MRVGLFLIFYTFLSCQARVVAQPQDPRLIKVEELFKSWNLPDHPGGSVAISQKGKILYSKAFGLASLEYRVPNTTETLFNTASVSKQFTAYGILLLEKQGKLSLEDDIRKYLTEMPRYGQKVTIRHLLHHTSGLRSLHALLELAGWSDDDRKTTADLMRLMADQRKLNFVPGSEYLYCNTGYIFMSQIIERITGEPFTVWMVNNVFLPLGLSNTYVEDNVSRVVPSKATSYYGPDGFGNFLYAIPFWEYEGSGNVQSTSEDLIKWMTHLNHPEQNGDVARKMFTRGVLNSGDTINYALGLVVDTFRGRSRWGHSGSIGGYRARIHSYPDDELNIVVLGNYSSSNPNNKSIKIAEIMLDLEEVKDADSLVTSSNGHVPFVTQKRVEVATETFDRFVGNYEVNELRQAVLVVFREADRFYLRLSGETRDELFPSSDSTFFNPHEKFTITFWADGKRSPGRFKADVENGSFSGKKMPSPSERQLQKYAGTYYSAELMTHYFIRFEGAKLFAYHPRLGQIPMDHIREREFSAPWPLVRVTFHDGGLMVTNGRVRDLWLKKVGNR